MASSAPDHEVTVLLRQWRNGDRDAHDRLLALVYDELRRIARVRLRAESAHHTLQPTALVHEAYLRLMGSDAAAPQNRTHLLSLAARVMRQVLVDHARKRNAGKRGGGATSITISDHIPAREGSIVDVLALDEALTDLATLDQRLCQVVELKCFTGLNIQETADALGVSTATVERDWAVAKAWLFDRLSTPRLS
jgi:RNA polymerase sigma factor (TIGR02999 family)